MMRDFLQRQDESELKKGNRLTSLISFLFQSEKDEKELAQICQLIKEKFRIVNNYDFYKFLKDFEIENFLDIFITYNILSAKKGQSQNDILINIQEF